MPPLSHLKNPRPSQDYIQRKKNCTNLPSLHFPLSLPPLSSIENTSHLNSKQNSPNKRTKQPTADAVSPGVRSTSVLRISRLSRARSRRAVVPLVVTCGSGCRCRRNGGVWAPDTGARGRGGVVAAGQDAVVVVVMSSVQGVVVG